MRAARVSVSGGSSLAGRMTLLTALSMMCSTRSSMVVSSTFCLRVGLQQVGEQQLSLESAEFTLLDFFLQGAAFDADQACGT